MYLSFYKLNENPFQITTDPRFLWLGAKHEEGLAALEYSLSDNKAFLLLTGDVGTGKTTLINSLLKSLGDDTLFAVIRDPNLEPLDFFNYLSYVFKLGKKIISKGYFFVLFEKFLHKSYEANKKVLLIIDEAQRINKELLEEIELLLDIEREGRRLLNIFIVGQLECNEILLLPENKAIRQRITTKYNIPTLSELEIGQYINHRLIIAGAEETIYTLVPFPENKKNGYVDHVLMPSHSQEEIFTEKAIKEIYSFSKGYPRLINIICDRCLFTGFVEGSKRITAEIVRECKEELEIQLSERISEKESQLFKMKRKKSNSLPGKSIIIEDISTDNIINDSSQYETLSSEVI